MEEIECSSWKFLGIPDRYSSLESSYFHILPVPYDATSSYVAGARFGPRAIIEASHQIELYDAELAMAPADLGIATHDEVPVVAGDPEGMIARIEERVGEIRSLGGLPVILGGEHTVALGSIRTFDDSDLMVVSLDAHGDLRDTYQGNRYSHACFLRRVSDEHECAAFGIRSISKAEVNFISQKSIPVFYARDMIGAIDAIDLEFIPEKIYITIDIDVLDCSIMPSAGTPEPGGLGWYDVVSLLERIITSRRILGFDVVELCPQPHNVAPDFTAAKLVYKVMGLIAKYSRNREVDATSHGQEKK